MPKKSRIHTFCPKVRQSSILVSSSENVDILLLILTQTIPKNSILPLNLFTSKMVFLLVMTVNLILLVKQLTSKKIHNPSLDRIKRRSLGARAAQGDRYHQFFHRDVVPTPK